VTAPGSGAEMPAGDRHDTLRQRIATEAARGIEAGSDARRAVFRAARRVARGWVPDDQLPSRDEITGEAQHRVDPTRALARLVGDRFDRIAALVGLLVTVRRNSATYPEGDALEHTLQVFDHVHAERPFDEELLTAALVHDIGLAIDRADPVAATLEAVEGFVTPRTRWLVEMLPSARAYGDCTLGKRGRQRLESHPDFEDVLLLAEADRRGHARGAAVPSLEEAVAILRALDADDTPDDAAAREAST
jgi:hypothetical protein